MEEQEQEQDEGWRFESMREKVDSETRARREGRESAVDALRRYGTWLVAAFVLLPLPLAILLSLAGVAVYLVLRGVSKRRPRA